MLGTNSFQVLDKEGPLTLKKMTPLEKEGPMSQKFMEALENPLGNMPREKITENMPPLLTTQTTQPKQSFTNSQGFLKLIFFKRCFICIIVAINNFFSFFFPGLDDLYDDLMNDEPIDYNINDKFSKLTVTDTVCI